MISIIIPTHPNENKHRELVNFIEGVDSTVEVIVSKSENRAQALNRGASLATHNFLWFVHADSIVNKEHIAALRKLSKQTKRVLYFFDLKFRGANTPLIMLNEIGANLRSKYLKLPWGDQGFAMSKETYISLNRFDETLKYGEDHIMVWRAHQNNIELQRIPLSIETSARGYNDQGWIKLTLIRQYHWIKQAIPQFYILFRGKIKRE